MIKAIAVDDDQDCLDAIKRLANEFEGRLELIATSQSVDDAYEKVSLLDPDLIFLDVEMPPKTGFDLLEMLDEYRAKVIFTTGHSEYAERAFAFHAIHYLPKPIDFELFSVALDRAELQHAIELKSEQNRLKDAHNTFLKPHEKVGRITLHSANETIVLDTAQVEHFKAVESSCFVFHSGGKRWMESKTLMFFEKLLKHEGFIRCHKSHMINEQFVERFDKKSNEVILKDGTRIPVSRRKLTDVKEALGVKKGWF